MLANGDSPGTRELRELSLSFFYAAERKPPLCQDKKSSFWSAGHSLPASWSQRSLI